MLYSSLEGINSQLWFKYSAIYGSVIKLTIVEVIIRSRNAGECANLCDGWFQLRKDVLV